MDRSPLNHSGKITFVTGTDTGAGKTVLAALLVMHLRRAGIHALAMKPFCSGGNDDVRLLRAAADDELTARAIAPFYSRRPVAPLVAQQQRGSLVSRAEVLARIRQLKSRCEWLVVEGAGGLLSPLGPGFNSADLIAELGCDVVMAGRNKLGIINHALLTLMALQIAGAKSVKIVLVDCADRDISSRTNLDVLAELVAPVQVLGIPFLRGNVASAEVLRTRLKIIEKTLARAAGSDSFRCVVGGRRVESGRKKQESD